MAAVHIDNLTAGMVLADDVRDITSRLLLSKGSRIGDRHIRIFKIWGISEVPIQGGAEETDPRDIPIPPAVMAETRDRLREKFKHNDLAHPAVKELFRICVLHHSRYPHPVFPEKSASVDAPRPENRSRLNMNAQIAAATIDLPEMPAMIGELNDVIATPFASASDIARIVQKSPSLTGLLLKIVNSALYGFSRKIDSISRAVTMIGSKEITGLAIGISAMRLFGDIPGRIVDMPAFIRHSLACAIFARILAAHKNMRQTEQMFVSGLLHDIGRLVIFKYFPEQIKAAMHCAARNRQPLYAVEKQTMGSRHTDVAKLILNRWNFSLLLENNIVYHHRPIAARDPFGAAVVHLADIIAHGLALGSSGERLVPPLDKEAWDLLGMSPGFFRQMIRQALHQLGSLENFMTMEG